jgi:hypothetical protein
VLCQVEFARKIANRTNRQLVVQSETGSPKLKHRFAQAFSDVFVFIDSHSNPQSADLRTLLSSHAEPFPPIYGSFRHWHNKSLEEFTAGSQSQSRLVNHPPKRARLIIHEGFGGGDDSHVLLEHVNLVPSILAKARNLVAKVPDTCTAIHFRNSDYRSSFESLCLAISQLVPEAPVLIATDDKSVLTKLTGEFPTRTFLSASELLSDLSFTTPTEGAVLELLLISSCSDLVLIPLQGDGVSGPAYSGFGLLAKHLWSVRRIQEKGIHAFIEQLFDTALMTPRGQRNIFRLAALIGLKAPRLFREGFVPSGVYRQLGEIR